MEAATLKKKKTSINKGKVKRTIKNVLCRPDPVFWPNVSEQETKLLEDLLSKYKVDIPEFTKLHWKELKKMPKDERPKQPKIMRVEGLIHGLRECSRALQSNESSAVIIESSVNPQTIMQPLIEACISANVPVLCMLNLKKICSRFFGIPTNCLGVRNNSLQQLSEQINIISKQHKPLKPVEKFENNDMQDNTEVYDNTDDMSNVSTPFIYLYRTDKTNRVFTPSTGEGKTKSVFIGQDYIQVSNKPGLKVKDSKAYMSMILKKIGNNQNRVKRK